MLFDVGCKKNSYCSDMTRTFFYKSASEKGREVYEIVKKANLAAQAVMKPGMKFCEIDKVARDSLDRPLDHVGPADPAHRGSLGGPAARAETVRHLRYHRSRGSPFLCNNIHNSS